MRTRYRTILFATIGFIALAIVLTIHPIAHGSTARPLAEKVGGADAIVVGTVAEIETKRWALTLFEKGSNGERPVLKKNFDLAVLHLTKILKADVISLANKVDAKNPVGWMHMAFQTSTGGPFELDKDLWRPTASKGDKRIWFLRRDLILTGHYFIWDVETVTETQIKEIENLVRDQRNGM